MRRNSFFRLLFIFHFTLKQGKVHRCINNSRCPQLFHKFTDSRIGCPQFFYQLVLDQKSLKATHLYNKQYKSSILWYCCVFMGSGAYRYIMKLPSEQLGALLMNCHIFVFNPETSQPNGKTIKSNFFFQWTSVVELNCSLSQCKLNSIKMHRH